MKNTNEVVVSNAFGRLLSEFRNGASQVELSEAMQECVKAVKESGRAATVIYKLTFTPSNSAVVVSDKIERKLPMPDREGAIFYATEQNTLSRNDPTQQEFQLKEVKQEPQEVRDVQPATVVMAS